MNKRKLHIVISIWGILFTMPIITACSDENILESTDGKDIPIMLSSAGVATEIGTRSYYADAYNTELPGSELIDVFIYDQNSTDISISQSTDQETAHTWVYQTVGSANGGKSSLALVPSEMNNYSKTPKYPNVGNDPSTHVSIFAIYPHKSGITPSTDSYTFSVSDTQTTEEAITGGDLMAHTITQYTATDCENNIELTLRHKMAKVKVTFTPAGDLTAANMPTTFKVLNVYRTVTITPSTGTISKGNADLTSTSAPLTALSDQAFFIPSQTVSEELLSFDILGSGNFNGITGCSFTPSSAIEFNENTCYEIEVTVDVDHITATATITPWVNNDMSDSDFEQTKKIIL